MKYEVATDQFIEHLSQDRYRQMIFLDDHPTLRNMWQVESINATFLSRFGDLVGPYRAVSPFGYGKLVELAEEEGFEIAFWEDPAPVFDWVRSLDGPTGVKLNAAREGTTKEGFYPFQSQGINFAKGLRAAVLQWSTGTGKTVGACALTQFRRQRGEFDLAIYVVKKNHKIGTVRSLKALVDIDAIMVDGGQSVKALRELGIEVRGQNSATERRDLLYGEIDRRVEAGERPVIVCNYETFKNDKAAMMALVEGRKLWTVWDEMPNKLKTRSTALYKAITEVLYTHFKVYKGKRIYHPLAGAERPAELRSVMLSATPIENSPDDWFNCVRLLDPDVYGSISQYESDFVLRKDPFRNNIYDDSKLGLIGAKAAFMVHQVDKEDPDIAVQFPNVDPAPDTIYLELPPEQRRLYDLLANEYVKLKDDALSELDDTELLGAINVLQWVCDNPLMVKASADRWNEYANSLDMFVATMTPDPTELAEWVKKNRSGSEVAAKLVDMAEKAKVPITDKNHPKLIELKEDLERGEKAVVFTRFNDTLLPILSRYLTQWGIGHVVFSGGMTPSNIQYAIDTFMNDDNTQVFLSSDAGSDSISLGVGEFALDYDLPWKWATKTQRRNRIHRIDSAVKMVRYRTYVTVGTVEERTEEIVATKFGYHKAVFKGEIAEQAQELRRGDLMYILTGREVED